MFVDEGSEGIPHTPRKTVIVTGPKSQENPFVCTDIEISPQVPEGRHDKFHMFANPAQFIVESVGVFNMFNGVRAKDVVKCLVLEGQVVDIVYFGKVRNVSILHNVCINPSPISVAATDIQVPFPALQDEILNHMVTHNMGQQGICGEI